MKLSRVKRNSFLISDELDELFLFVIALIGLLVALATILDIRFKPNECMNLCKLLVVYQRTFHCIYPAAQNKFTKFLSLRANYQSFLNVQSTRKPQEFDCIHSMKFLTMLLVILGHCVLMHSVFPFSNPEFIESVS